jgi:hypothetical protein
MVMDQIDLYCAQGAEEVAAEEDSTYISGLLEDEA